MSEQKGMYRALYDFDTKQPGALSFKKDEILQVFEKVDEFWLRGKNKTGDMGLLPASYLQPQEGQASSSKGQQYFAGYDYKGESSLHLSVSRGQKLYLIKEIDDSWWNMKSEKGRVGLVPKQYIQHTRPQPEHSDKLDPKAQMEVLQSTDNAIEQIHQEATASGGHYTAQQRNVLQQLIAHRQFLVQPNPSASATTSSNPLQSTHRRQAPAPPTREMCVGDASQKKGNKRKAPSPPSASSKAVDEAQVTTAATHSKQELDHHQNQQENKKVPDEDMSSYVVVERKMDDIIREFDLTVGTELVEAVRTNCDISHAKSLTAVQVVLEFIGSVDPHLQETLSAISEAVHKSQASVVDTAAKLETSADHEKLSQLFEQITDVKNDSQQRGWAVHDDLSTITSCLDDLLQRLGDADPAVSLAVIQEYKYENVLTLITYYQMETRTSLRMLLLQLFGLVCELELEVVSVLLNSVLPNELGRDIHDNLDDKQKVLYSALVCTMIFSTAEVAPVSVYDQFSVEYVTFLLDTIESSAADDSMEDIADGFLNLLLSFNQHFNDPADNIVMNSLMKQPNRKIFGEKLILLVNREEDPVAIKEPNVPSSLTKMLLDLYAHPTTASLFYTNDLLVIIDIITRQLSDLNPDDKNRGHFLELLYRLLKNTEYGEHHHRQADLELCLTRIFEEEEQHDNTASDKETVKMIWKDFKDYFKYFTLV